jgi:hypothetical protein
MTLAKTTRTVLYALVTIAVALSVASCVTLHDVSNTQIDETMDRWITGMTTEDIDLMMSAYAEDAVLTAPGPDGEIVSEGRKAIRAVQLDGMSQGDWSIFKVDRYTEAETKEGTRAYAVTVPGEVTLVNTFTYAETGSEVLISTQRIEAGPPLY